MKMMTAIHIASERRDARSAINTIRSVVSPQADRRCVVDRPCVMMSILAPLCGHLGEMRPTMMVGSGRGMSHISDMRERRSYPYSTTLRNYVARMVLLAPVGTSHVSDMRHPLIASERRDARSAINTIRSVVDRPSVMMTLTPLCVHLGEMRPTMMVGSGGGMSHISDMRERRGYPYSTTLRNCVACMVLLAPVGTSHVSDMRHLLIASERRDARSAINTIRSVVDRPCVMMSILAPLCVHLGEMRPTMMDGSGGGMSHISDMRERRGYPYSTTLRNCVARVVLIAPIGTSHVSDMMRQSVLEEVLLFDFHSVLCQELAVLLGKCLTTMMLFLLGDILHYHVFVSQTIRKARILFGPSVEKRKVRIGLEPLAGGDLDFLHELGHRQRCWQRHKKVHMVRHSANAVKTTSDIVDKAKHVSVKFPLMILINGRDATMCTKYDMIECLCVTHITTTNRYADYCIARIASKRRHAPRAINTIQAKRRVVS